ncbi:hypothetical protein D3C75_1091350 [compost metagenome]
MRRTPSPTGAATVTSVLPSVARRVPSLPARIQPLGRSKRRSGLSMRKRFLPMRGQPVSTAFQPSGSSNCKRLTSSTPDSMPIFAAGTRSSPRSNAQSGVMRASKRPLARG